MQYGALYAPLVVLKKEYYRLVTAMFMHFGIHHLVNNMLVLFVLGDNLERALGRVKYLIFYLACGIGANLVSVVLLLDNTSKCSIGRGVRSSIWSSWRPDLCSS